MRSRGLWMLILALLAGLTAVVLASRWLNGKESTGARVVIAAVDIPLGTPLSPEMLKVVDWPRESVPQGAFQDPGPLKDRVMTVNIQRGEAVLDSRLAPEGSKGGMSGLVAPGKRAMTVRVNDVVGVAGFALPGTFVDVMVNTQDERSGNNERERAISKIVLNRILVLAVAQEVDRDPTKPKVVNAVTLEVTPEQAEALDLARSVGTLSLVLRNQTESEAAGTRGATKENLLGHNRAEVAADPVAKAPPGVAPRPVARPSTCVEVIRAGVRSNECF